jgi:hypothetical protein
MSLTINIPTSIRFTSARRQWHLRRARVLGLSKDFLPEARWPALTPIHSVSQEIALALYNPDDGWILSAEPDQLYTPAGFPSASLTERYAPRGVLSTALFGPMEFDVFVSTPDPIDEMEDGPERDAWVMRDEFLSLPKKNRALGKFLNKWGHWDFSQLKRLNETMRNLKDVSWLMHYVVPDLVWEQQEFYKQALSGDMRSWISQRGRIPSPQPSSTPPFLAITDRHCVPAIETTITLDKMRDIPFRICQRPNCGTLFKLASKRVRLYCTYDCAHAEAVRRGREAKKRTLGKRK